MTTTSFSAMAPLITFFLSALTSLSCVYDIIVMHDIIITSSSHVTQYPVTHLPMKKRLGYICSHMKSLATPNKMPQLGVKKFAL